MGDMTNWILFIFCTFMCYFGMMGMGTNCFLLKNFVDDLIKLIFFVEPHGPSRLVGE